MPRVRVRGGRDDQPPTWPRDEYGSCVAGRPGSGWAETACPSVRSGCFGLAIPADAYTSPETQLNPARFRSWPVMAWSRSRASCQRCVSTRYISHLDRRRAPSTAVSPVSAVSTSWILSDLAELWFGQIRVRFDWVLLGGGFQVLKSEHIVEQEGNVYPSDHVPVAAGSE